VTSASGRPAARIAPSTASSASRLWGGCRSGSGTGRSQSLRACVPGSVPAMATAFAFAFVVQEGGHLVQVDAQVFTVGPDPLKGVEPGAD